MVVTPWLQHHLGLLSGGYFAARRLALTLRQAKDKVGPQKTLSANRFIRSSIDFQNSDLMLK